MENVTRETKDLGYRRRVYAFNFLLIVLSPIALVVWAVSWMMEGLSLRECYWRLHPEPRTGLRELREEEKWPYIRSMEGRIAELESLLETTDIVIRRKINEAIEDVNFAYLLRPVLEASVAAEALRLREEAHPIMRVEWKDPVEAVQSEAEKKEAEVVASHPAEVSSAVVGDAVAEAVRNYTESIEAPIDPELKAAIERIRAGAGDLE